MNLEALYKNEAIVFWELMSYFFTMVAKLINVNFLYRLSLWSNVEIEVCFFTSGYHHNWCKDFVHYTFVIFLFDL
jgi:hypothetical protein